MELRSKNRTIKRWSFNPATGLAEVPGDTVLDGARASNGASAALELTTASVFSRSKETMCCGLLSSKTVKSSGLRSLTGLPFLSRTVTFTSTSSVLARKVYSPDCCWEKTSAHARVITSSEASVRLPRFRTFKNCMLNPLKSEARRELNRAHRTDSYDLAEGWRIQVAIDCYELWRVEDVRELCSHFKDTGLLQRNYLGESHVEHSRARTLNAVPASIPVLPVGRCDERRHVEPFMN